MLFVVAMLMLVLLHMFIHGIHEGVQSYALLDRLFRLLGGGTGRRDGGGGLCGSFGWGINFG